MISAVKRSVMRIIVLPAGRCRFLEENESVLRFRRSKIWWFTECTIPYDRPSNISGNDGENIIFSFLRLIGI